MATYSFTAEQLKGKGILLDEIINSLAGGGANFAMTNPSSGSAYFTFETVRNSNGDYEGVSPTVTGIIAENTNVKNLVSSPFIWSVSVDPGVEGDVNFDPDENIPANSAMIRATGGISLVIETG
tara:strand:- start:352 stop:723 length:372 start_codon:yes stop_codon:yes gene_type:complete